MPELSAVYPAFNEGENIGAAVRACLDVFDAAGVAGEVVVVDDGSSDDTAARVGAVHDPRVRLVQHPQNRGYGAALRSGFAAAEGEWVFFTDADLQFDVGELTGFWENRHQAPCVFGYRWPRRDPLHRRVNGALWTRISGMVLGAQVRDLNCAFKLFRGDVLHGLDLQAEGASINAELVMGIARKGLSIVELPVKHYPRVAGEQTGANWRVMWRAFQELWALRQRSKSNAR